MPTCQVCGSDVPDDSGHTTEDFRGIVRRWERLRLFYVGWLGFLVLVGAALLFPFSATLDFWLVVGAGAIVANLCFFAGPAIELYGTSYRVWEGSWTTLLFLAGTGFASLLAVVAMFGVAFLPPDQM